jgi:DNA primase
VRKLERVKQEQFIEEVKENNDIIAVISEYVKLKRRGSSYTGLCPFHSEKTPSFTVSREKQLFYCFGCGAGGDVINFIMRIENLDFPQTIRFLAERANLPLPSGHLSPNFDQKRRERERIHQLNTLAAAFYQKVLLQTDAGKKGLDYLQKRGISPEAVKSFNLGYALPHWTGLVEVLRKKGISLIEAEKAGLVRGGANGFYDRFRDRLIFPILNPRGKIVGFGGRLMDEGEPKYLNSPETLIFQKGRYLYGLFQAREAIRKEKQAIIVEGYTDVIQAHQQGILNVVASLGTALTMEQVRTLKRYTGEVIIAYDADAAGQSATIRGLDLLYEAGVRVGVATLPEGEDPDSLIKNQGAEVFLGLVEKNVDLFTFQLNYILSKKDLSSPEGKAQAVEETFGLLSQVKNKIAREAYIKQIATTVGVSETTFYDQWRTYQYNLNRSNQRLDIKKQLRHTNDNIHTQQILSEKEKNNLQSEREVLRGCLQEKNNLERIKEALAGIKWSSPACANIFQKLVEWDNPEEWPPPASVFSPENQILYVELITENEMNPLPIDLKGCCDRIRQQYLIKEIQRLQKEVAVTAEGQENNSLSAQNLQEDLALLNKLHKKLRDEFPTFSGLI